jgi:hypothetical protein
MAEPSNITRRKVLAGALVAPAALALPAAADTEATVDHAAQMVARLTRKQMREPVEAMMRYVVPHMNGKEWQVVRREDLQAVCDAAGVPWHQHWAEGLVSVEG